jgi:hypothetical protein
MSDGFWTGDGDDPEEDLLLLLRLWRWRWPLLLIQECDSKNQAAVAVVN